MTVGKKLPRAAIPKLELATGTPAKAADFKRALRQIVSPVAIVTAKVDGELGGQTVTTFCSVSTDPPTFLVCLNRGSAVSSMIAASGHFAVSLLAEEQHLIARSFSASDKTNASLFSKGNWGSLVCGAPVLDGGVVCLDCEVENRIEAGSHDLYLGRILALTTAERDILLYRDGLFRRLQPAG
jgi:flavin reductase